MSLYNSLFGVDSLAGVVLKAAGLEMSEIPRFRDAYFKEGRCYIFTRTGGGNRECYSENDDHSECYHTLNDGLVAKGNYRQDYDDDFDTTYATFVFAPLPEFEELAQMASKSDDPKAMDQFKIYLEKLSKASPDSESVDTTP